MKTVNAHELVVSTEDNASKTKYFYSKDKHRSKSLLDELTGLQYGRRRRSREIAATIDTRKPFPVGASIDSAHIEKLREFLDQNSDPIVGGGPFHFIRIGTLYKGSRVLVKNYKSSKAKRFRCVDIKAWKPVTCTDNQFELETRFQSVNSILIDGKKQFMEFTVKSVL
jgi:hypothetical protein